MELLEAILSPPRADHVLVGKYIIIALSLFFVPYISILFGSSLFAVGFSFRGKTEANPLFDRLGADIAETFLGKIGVSLVLGVVPIITMAFCYAQWLYGTGVKVSQYFLIILVLFVLGLITMNLFRKSFAKRDSAFLPHLGLGLTAHGLFALTIYVYVSVVSTINWPEKWPLIDTPVPWTENWNQFAHFAHLTTLAVAMTGVAIFFFFLNWNGGKEGMDEEYRSYVRKFAGGVGLGFGLMQAVPMLWHVATLPVMVKSWPLYGMAILSVGVMLLACLWLFTILYDRKVSLGTPVFVAFMAFFLVLLINQNIARDEALLYQNYALQKINDDMMLQIETERVERGGAAEASLELGETIYNQKCIACHRFDQRIVGPPYNSVLPKYEGDVEKLSGFILNPVKVDPDYIQMPNQGLKPHEAESVAQYLLQEWQANQGQ